MSGLLLHLAGAVFVFIFLVYMLPSGKNKSGNKKGGRNLRDRDFDGKNGKQGEQNEAFAFLKDQPIIKDFRHKKVDDKYKQIVRPGPIKKRLPDIDEVDTIFTRMTANGAVEARRVLVTNYEHQYLEKLRLWFGDTHYVFCQVAVGSVIKINADVLSDQIPQNKRRLFAQKCHNMSFDFMLVERRTDRVICAIELDDPTHTTPDRMQRDTRLDKVCEAAKLPIFHITDIFQKPDISKIVP